MAATHIAVRLQSRGGNRSNFGHSGHSSGELGNYFEVCTHYFAGFYVFRRNVLFLKQLLIVEMFLDF